MINATFLGFYCEIGFSRKDSDGNSYFNYRAVTPNDTLFVGGEFKPSGGPNRNWQTPNTVINLLWWLTLSPGDADDSRFAHYNDEQLRFANLLTTPELHFCIEEAESKLSSVECIANDAHAAIYRFDNFPNDLMVITQRPDKIAFFERRPK